MPGWRQKSVRVRLFLGCCWICLRHKSSCDWWSVSDLSPVAEGSPAGTSHAVPGPIYRAREEWFGQTVTPRITRTGTGWWAPSRATFVAPGPVKVRPDGRRAAQSDCHLSGQLRASVVHHRSAQRSPWLLRSIRPTRAAPSWQKQSVFGLPPLEQSGNAGPPTWGGMLGGNSSTPSPAHRIALCPTPCQNASVSPESWGDSSGPMGSSQPIRIGDRAIGLPRIGFVLRLWIRKADSARGEAAPGHGPAGTRFFTRSTVVDGPPSHDPGRESGWPGREPHSCWTYRSALYFAPRRCLVYWSIVNETRPSVSCFPQAHSAPEWNGSASAEDLRQ
jgi:hypothetical protein